MRDIEKEIAIEESIYRHIPNIDISGLKSAVNRLYNPTPTGCS